MRSPLDGTGCHTSHVPPRISDAANQKLRSAEIVPVRGLGFKVEVMITVGGSWWPETTFTQRCLILIAWAVQMTRVHDTTDNDDDGDDSG